MLMLAAWKLGSVKGHRILTVCGTYCSSLVWSNRDHPNLSQCFSAFLIYRKVWRNVQEVPILLLNENFAFHFLPYPISTCVAVSATYLSKFSPLAFNPVVTVLTSFFQVPLLHFSIVTLLALWLLVASDSLLRYFFILYVCFFFSFSSYNWP